MLLLMGLVSVCAQVKLMVRMKSAEEKHGEFSGREQRIELVQKVAKVPLGEALQLIKDALKGDPHHWVTGTGPGKFACRPARVTQSRSAPT